MDDNLFPRQGAALARKPHKGGADEKILDCFSGGVQPDFRECRSGRSREEGRDKVGIGSTKIGKTENDDEEKSRHKGGTD